MNFLKKLFGAREQQSIELPPEFLQANPPDWLIELKATRLPPGHRSSIRVELIAASRNGTADIFILRLDGNADPKSSATNLPRFVLDKLFVILGFSFPNDITDVSSMNKNEGMPVAISIHHRDPYSIRAAECNLTDWLDSKKSGPPVIEISRLLVEATGLLPAK